MIDLSKTYITADGRETRGLWQEGLITFGYYADAVNGWTPQTWLTETNDPDVVYPENLKRLKLVEVKPTHSIDFQVVFNNNKSVMINNYCLRGYNDSEDGIFAIKNISIEVFEGEGLGLDYRDPGE